MLCYFEQCLREFLSDITNEETFATGRGIREIPRLKKVYGAGRWRKRKGIARIRLPDASEHIAEVHWYEASGIGRKEFKIKRILFITMKKSQFVICISNEGYEASLELKKIYEVVADAEAAAHKQLRVIDESGEDYLYPTHFFVSIEIPAALRAQLSEVA